MTVTAFFKKCSEKSAKTYYEYLGAREGMAKHHEEGVPDLKDISTKCDIGTFQYHGLLCVETQDGVFKIPAPIVGRNKYRKFVQKCTDFRPLN